MDGYYGPNTDTMNDKWGNITSKQKEIYTRIIMGNDLNTEWDSWITFFEQQGGKDITEEVNAWKAEQ